MGGRSITEFQVFPMNLTDASLVIPAAGCGTRLGSVDVPSKALIDIGGLTVVEHTLDLWIKLSGPKIIGVPRHTTEHFRAAVGDRLCRILECERGGGLGSTLVELLQLTAPDRPVVVVLGDDLSVFNRTEEILEPIRDGATASQGIVWESVPEAVADACAVSLEGSRIVRIIEKPVPHAPAWRGCGVYGLSPRAVTMLRSGTEGLSVDFDKWATAGELLIGVPLVANVNINRCEDLAAARILFHALSLLKRDGVAA